MLFVDIALVSQACSASQSVVNGKKYGYFNTNPNVMMSSVLLYSFF